MNKTHYRIDFASFGPIYVWETNANNAIIRAKYQRLEEGLSTDVLAVHLEKDGQWINCNISEFVRAA